MRKCEIPNVTSAAEGDTYLVLKPKVGPHHRSFPVNYCHDYFHFSDAVLINHPSLQELLFLLEDLLPKLSFKLPAPSLFKSLGRPAKPGAFSAHRNLEMTPTTKVRPVLSV